MKKISTYLGIALLGIMISGFVLFFSHSVNAKQLSTNSINYQFISDINKTTQDLQALKQMNITIDNTSAAPKITPSQAVNLASEYRPDYAGQATNTVVEYCQLTNPSMTVFSDSAKEKNQSLAQNGFLLKVPSYIVSFEGITRTAIVPYGVQAPILHEYNVVIDANSGEYLFGFTYR